MSLEILTLTDATSGAMARIVPALGFNCYSFTIGAANGPAAPVDVLWASPEFAEGTVKPTRCGIPLMFPFAGRIRGGAYQYAGKQYTLQVSDGLGNAIHGFVITRPWRVVQQDADYARGEFQASLDDPTILGHWPADFRITVDYRVTGTSLVSEITIENPDRTPLPFGFGTHPYFRIPLGGNDADACRVRVPVGSNWDLENLLPTGNQSTPSTVGQIAAGMTAGEMHLDHVFGKLTFDQHCCTPTLYDPQSKRTMTLTFDDQFMACVVFNPPHRQAVCIEPYTTLPDAFALTDRGIDAHLRVLKPGETFRTRIEIAVS